MAVFSQTRPVFLVDENKGTTSQTGNTSADSPFLGTPIHISMPTTLVDL